MRSATATWTGLPLPWQVAFDEAWASFQAGNFGIGAVLTDPAAEHAIVTVGRNRVMQAQRAPRTLSGNMTAHAEMNAFAELDTFNAEGLHLFTTLEPCLMCAATAMQLKVERVSYAAADEFFVGMDDLWAAHPLTAQRRPESVQAFAGPLALFARFLPMSFTLAQFPGRSADQQARAAHPGLADLIERLADDQTWAEIRRSGTCHRALGHLWADLHTIAPTP